MIGSGVRERIAFANSRLDGIKAGVRLEVEERRRHGLTVFVVQEGQPRVRTLLQSGLSGRDVAQLAYGFQAGAAAYMFHGEG